MVYILGIEINEKKPLYYNLIKLYGINFTTSLKICSVIGLNPFIPLSLKLIKEGMFKDIQKYISRKYDIGTILQKYSRECIKKKIQIKSYQGMRHRLNLPVRGQRTHTNRMTQRHLKLI